MSNVLRERVDDMEIRLHQLERELLDVRDELGRESRVGSDVRPDPVVAPTRPVARPPVPVATRREPESGPPRRTLADVLADWDLLGARGLAAVGGIVTLLGIAFFFVLAANHGWIGPGTRVLLGGAAAALVFGTGLVLKHRYGQLHAALAAVGAGIGGAYTTLLAAAAIYDLVPEGLALVLAAAIAAAGVGVAILWSSELIAGLGLGGAAALPALYALDRDLTAGAVAFVVLVLAARQC
jgi:uncharacterized membrane protein